MLGRIDCGPHRDRRLDTDAEMAIGSAIDIGMAGQGRPRMRPDGRGHLPDRLYGLAGTNEVPIWSTMSVVTNVATTCTTITGNGDLLAGIPIALIPERECMCRVRRRLAVVVAGAA
jgi:hypothetical protein